MLQKLTSIEAAASFSDATQNAGAMQTEENKK